MTKKKVVKKKKISKKLLKKKKILKVVLKNKPNDKVLGKPIGRVTHYFSNIKVGIIKCKKPIKIGDEVRFKGATTDFKQKISSMQYDYKEIKATPLNKEIGIKVKKRVREGDLIYK